VALALAGERRRTVTVLGATGSIGRNTLELIAASPERYRIEALTANGDVDGLAALARRHGARLAVIADPGRYRALRASLAGSSVEAATGAEALREAAARAEWVMAAIVGAAGLAPTLEALSRGAIVALANKECLVSAGSLFMRALAEGRATLVPVDSEHNAIFQALRGEDPDAVERLVLTASGGPFRAMPAEAMADVTPGQAAAHPNWRMGVKISIDSATMMNKGLELIEAHHLFRMPEDRIDILVHPQSVVHSMVAFRDGSVMAQLGTPDMRIPIAYALGWPRRIAAHGRRLDLAALGSLTFEPPDPARFPALRLAREALRTGGAAPTILNAANEIAVEAFLGGRIGFLAIARIVEEALAASDPTPPRSLDDVLSCDRQARRTARELVQRHAGRGPARE
jgi:1-deoxy-D-xylulose-5-phosphate reductoisomerase